MFKYVFSVILVAIFYFVFLYDFELTGTCQRQWDTLRD